MPMEIENGKDDDKPLIYFQHKVADDVTALLWCEIVATVNGLKLPLLLLRTAFNLVLIIG